MCESMFPNIVPKSALPLTLKINSGRGHLLKIMTAREELARTQTNSQNIVRFVFDFVGLHQMTRFGERAFDKLVA